MTINKKQIAFNRTARTQKPRYIVIHDTGNSRAGANADAHFSFFNGGNRQASYDFVVDDTQILQVNDYTRFFSWHSGDGNGRFGITNHNSVGVGICINSDGDYATAWNNAVKLTRFLMAELNIPAERVVRHFDASRKNCPASMAANGWARWNEFKTAVSAENKSEEVQIVNIETREQALERLVEKGVINSPDYWATACDVVNHLERLLINMANTLGA